METDRELLRLTSCHGSEGEGCAGVRVRKRSLGVCVCARVWTSRVVSGSELTSTFLPLVLFIRRWSAFSAFKVLPTESGRGDAL